MCEPQFHFQLAEQRVGKLHIGCIERLGQHDCVEIFTGFLNNGDDVFMAPLRANIIDANTASFFAPIEIVQRLGNCLARCCFGRWRNGIFQIAKNMVGG